MLKRMLALLVVLVPVAASAAEGGADSSREFTPEIKGGTTGLSFGVPSGGGPTTGFTYFLAEDQALRIDVGTLFLVPEQGDPGLLLSVEAGYRLYLTRAGRLMPFVQPGIFVRSYANEELFDVDALDLALTGSLGVEFFFLEQFSVSGQTGLALSATRGFQDVALSTGTSALFANFYW